MARRIAAWPILLFVVLAASASHGEQRQLWECIDDVTMKVDFECVKKARKGKFSDGWKDTSMLLCFICELATCRHCGNCSSQLTNVLDDLRKKNGDFNFIFWCIWATSFFYVLIGLCYIQLRNIKRGISKQRYWVIVLDILDFITTSLTFFGYIFFNAFTDPFMKFLMFLLIVAGSFLVALNGGVGRESELETALGMRKAHEYIATQEGYAVADGVYDAVVILMGAYLQWACGNSGFGWPLDVLNILLSFSTLLIKLLELAGCFRGASSASAGNNYTAVESAEIARG